MISSWPCPGSGEEYALTFDRGREIRVLVLPALFDEANKLRHFTVEVMRLLDANGLDSFLPDLPGCNESLAPMERQSINGWIAAADAAAQHFAASHVLSLRGGALCAPSALPEWRYAPATGASVLRGLLRARVLAAREEGREETREALLEVGRAKGLELAGYRLGPAMIRQLEIAKPSGGAALANLGQADIGGAGLWLRAEPGHDTGQASALAELIVGSLRP